MREWCSVITVSESEINLPQLLVNPPHLHPVMPYSAWLRTTPEDFQVEEIPAYEPAGTGEHLYLWVEKRGLKHGAMLRQIAEWSGTRIRDIGTAGRKDETAVTRQFVSIPYRDRLKPQSISDQLTVLSAVRHSNRLRTGHLQGNQFRITARLDRTLEAAELAVLHQRLSLLNESGFPNYFGPQRFGGTGQSLPQAVAAVLSNRKRRSHAARFDMSVIQSAVFNVTLAERVKLMRIAPEPGDVVIRRGGRKPFAFDERGETPREDLVTAGPLPGRKMVPAFGFALQVEQLAMDRCGVTDRIFDENSKVAPGARRPLLQSFGDLAMTVDQERLVLMFKLPPGSYATVALRELFKILS